MLRQVIIGRKISKLKEDLQKLREKDTELIKREAQLSKATEEAATDEEIGLVEEEVTRYEADKEQNEQDKNKLEEDIRGLEKELEEINEKVKAAGSEAEPEARGGNVKKEVRELTGMGIREKAKQLATREDTKDFLLRVRDLKGQTRAVQGGELLIPETVLEVLRDNIDKFSKLIVHVKLKKVNGKARQNIAGAIPEAIWTEAVATLNEMEITFNQIEVDGFKVGGYIPIPNSTMEDSDTSLLTEIMEALAQAIGLAIDKAILYGTGRKMPLGIVTRLAQTAQPSDYPAKAPKWKNVSASNLKKLGIASKTGTDFFSSLILGLGMAKENYSDGRKFWCMNSTTKNLIMSKALCFDAAGTIVAMVKDEMPVIGGNIITLPFMADEEIVGGYGSLYLLAERKGGTFAVSEHAQFVEDNTLFKGTGRYDGKPVMEEGFVAVSLGSAAVTTTKEFAPDKANEKVTA